MSQLCVDKLKQAGNVTVTVIFKRTPFMPLFPSKETVSFVHSYLC